MGFTKPLFLLVANFALLYAQVDYSKLDQPSMKIMQNVSVLNNMDEEVVRMAMNLTVLGDYEAGRDYMLIANFLSDKFAYIVMHPEMVFGVSDADNSTGPMTGQLVAAESLYAGQGVDTSSTPSTTLQLTIDITCSEPSMQANMTFLQHLRAMV